MVAATDVVHRCFIRRYCSCLTGRYQQHCQLTVAAMTLDERVTLSADSCSNCTVENRFNRADAFGGCHVHDLAFIRCILNVCVFGIVAWRAWHDSEQSFPVGSDSDHSLRLPSPCVPVVEKLSKCDVRVHHHSHGLCSDRQLKFPFPQ